GVHGARQRARPGPAGLSRRSPAGGWRSHRQYPRAAGPEPAARHHEGRQVPQTTADPGAAPPPDRLNPGPAVKHPVTITVCAILAALVLWLFLALWPEWLVAAIGPKKIFVNTIFNGVTLAGLYFLVASGFTLVFGLMRNVNLAHGTLYLLGAYVGYTTAEVTGYWLVGVAAGFMSMAILGAPMQVLTFRRMEGDELRQTLVTIGLSIVAADLMLAIWSGKTYQFTMPDWLNGAVTTPIVLAYRSNGAAVPLTYPFYRLVVL